MSETNQSEYQKRSNKFSPRCAICAATSELCDHYLIHRDDPQRVEKSDIRVLCRRCRKLAIELIQAGIITFQNDSHHSRFAITKNAVKKSLGIQAKNMFNPAKGVDITTVDRSPLFGFS